MTSRYVANGFPTLLTVAPDEPKRRLERALEDIVARVPPREDYAGEKLSGLWAGPTGFAYLFLHVSRLHPHLRIGGHDALEWARKYMAGARADLDMPFSYSNRVGINCEKLAATAVQACIAQDLGCVRDFTDHVPQIVDHEESPNELLQGRAGVLYMLRMIREWVPGSEPLVEPYIRSITGAALADGQDWRWLGRRFLGAVHGDVGIVTQLVLTTPSLAGEFEEKMAYLLNLQLPDGNWPGEEGSKESYPLVQFCHGAPGFVPSLVALRPYFPSLHEKMDAAIEKGRHCIWEKGLLVKEPSICHGIFGNALYVVTQPRSPSCWYCI